MYYYDYKEIEIDKYKVDINREALLKIRREVIDNCSIIEHKDYYSTVIPNEDFLKVRNLGHKRDGVREYKDGPDEPLYRISYDEYKFPKLVDLIDKMLDNDVDVAIKLFKGEIKEEESSFKDQIREISKELDDIDNLNIKEKRKKLDELEKVIDQARLNNKQQSVGEYYIKIKNFIFVNKVDTIKREDVDRVNSFFERQKVKKI